LRLRKSCTYFEEDGEKNQIFKNSTPNEDRFEKVVRDNNKTLVLIILVLIFCLIASFLFILTILID